MSVTAFLMSEQRPVWEGPLAVSSAFADFFDAVWSDLSGYGRSLTGDAGIGDDLAQEALTRIYARWPLLREPRAYAFRIVTNLARDRWKALERERSTWSALLADEAQTEPDEDTLDAVRRLRDGHRDVLLLHYWADLSVADVASALHRPAGTIKRRLSEARAALLTSLEGTR
ncbi:MAG: polymerase sigma factor [Frankiales bacterium]|nr:polymerase sigma factor [Frankiales bacterium]